MKKAAFFLRSPSPFQSLLDEYFSEVQFEKLLEKDSAAQNADLIFAETSFCQTALIQKLRVAKTLNPRLRIFSLGEASREYAEIFDGVFPESCHLLDFSKKISEKIPLPETVRLLVADDDPDILAMLCDYFACRQAPVFEVLRAANGREAMDWVQKKRPDAMILDIKMPVMTGSELYCKLQKQNVKIPTIIFFDAISAGDLDTIKKAGRPVIVEKGYRDSSMAYLMAVVKKLVYFADC